MDNMNLSAICRTCLHTETTKAIFTNEVNPADYSAIVFNVTGIKIQMDDGLPQNICENCLNNINHTLDFRRKCKESETQLLVMKQKFESTKFSVSVKTEIGAENVTDENFNETVTKSTTEDTELKVEHIRPVEDDDDDKPLKYLLSKTNGKEILHHNNSFINIEQLMANFEIPESSAQKLDMQWKTKICQRCDKVVLMKNFHKHMTTYHNHTEESRVTCVKSKDPLNRHNELMDSMFTENATDSVLNRLKNDSVTNFPIEQHKTEEEIDTTDHLYELVNADAKRKRVKCKLCQKNLSIRSVDAHLAKRHPGADTRRVKCELCDTLVMKHKLNRHRALMHGSERLKCRYCKWVFDDKESLVRHVGACSSKKKRRTCESSRELRQCDVCHKTMQKASLRVHKAVKHSGLRPVCEHCGKSFGNKFRLHEHYRAKHGYEKFRCSYCDFRSASAMAMRNHERRHRGEKPFVCETCGAKFHAAYLLTQHKQSHATEKQFQCHMCPAAFKANNSLHMHKRTCHSACKFACAVCARAYSCRSYAVKHMRSVHRYSGPVPPLLAIE